MRPVKTNIVTLNDLINAPGRLFNFRGPSGAIYKQEAFKNSFILITVASSTKQICFQQKYQESLKKVD